MRVGSQVPLFQAALMQLSCSSAGSAVRMQTLQQNRQNEREHVRCESQCFGVRSEKENWLAAEQSLLCVSGGGPTVWTQSLPF